jgi:transposase
MKERRIQAADLLLRGVSQTEMARRLGVSHQLVTEFSGKS